MKVKFKSGFCKYIGDLSKKDCDHDWLSMYLSVHKESKKWDLDGAWAEVDENGFIGICWPDGTVKSVEFLWPSMDWVNLSSRPGTYTYFFVAAHEGRFLLDHIALNPWDSAVMSGKKSNIHDILVAFQKLEDFVDMNGDAEK